MRVLQSIVLPALLLSPAVSAASSWTFEDATLTVQATGAGIGGGAKENLSPSSALPTTVSLPAADSLKIIFTATEGKTGKRPHQAFLMFSEQEAGLEESFAFNLKENGKGKVEVTPKDLPYQFHTSEKALKASIVLASFGSSTPLKSHVFDVMIQADPNAPLAVPSPPERYSSMPEIHHIFKDDPRSPPMIISLFFTLAVAVALPALLGTWLLLGGNLDHFGKAFGASPVSHGVFLGSLLAMEGLFFMYYVSWTLFQMLPVAVVLGAVAYISGSRALTEVQDRRLAGER